MRPLVALLLLGLIGACAAAPAPRAAAPEVPRWTAVLVAGDSSIPVFDNAVDTVAALLAHSNPPAPVRLLRARTGSATAGGVLRAIAGLHPAAGQACFVFITSHGAHGPGVYLEPRDEFLSPAALDRALQQGCGEAPTVAVVSACYSGGFARLPMARPNRVILTAAAADRPSFGCGAGRDLAFYDECLIGALTSLPANWQDTIATTGRCVAAKEAAGQVRPSLPQGFVGRDASELPPLL